MGKYSIENLLRFSDRGASSLATSLLDEIVSQAEVDRENALYRLVNYRKGGSLVEGYLKGGEKELEKLANEVMKSYMYRDGQGEVLDEKVMETWRINNRNSSDKNNISIPIESDSNSNEKGKCRLVCWKLECRGILGESVLHVLVLCNTDVHSRMANILIKLFPALAKDIVEGEEYYGASALHFAIAYEDGKLAKNLVECGANVNQRARGHFFLPTDQQWPIPRKKTNFEGLSYLGEYPLAWAACCEDESSYNLLLKHGADPNMQDSFGNSILHVVVVRDKLKMYGYALRHPTKPASDRLLNKFGLTPLTLSCKLGRNKIFREMLELSSLEYWRYSNITCSGYPLNALDSIQPNGKTNLNSALMIILNGSTTEHLDMLEGGVIQRLLEEKWKTFAQRCFYRRLALMLLHLLNISIAVFLRPTTREPLLGRTDATSITRYCAEIGTCIGCVGFAIFQQAQEIAAQGLFGFFVNLISSPSKTAFVISCLLILSCIPCRVVGDRSTEDILLVLAIPGSWFFLIFFAGAVRLTGPFVTMIYSMVVGDMFRFSIIYVIFLFAFTQAFYFLFKSLPNEKADSKKRFSTFPVTWMGLFHMTLGSYEYEEFRETFYRKFTQLVFAMFMVFTPILLLNMLIAMMGNTYCEVITQSEKEWVKQWAKIVVVLERAIDQKSAKEFIQTYSIKMPSAGKDDDPDNEVRGVIVIKSKPKSKAKERKEALSLWKRVGKRTVHELRRFGGTAAEVRKRYNLFRSKQPTARLHMGRVIQEWTKTDPPPGPERKKENLGEALNQLAFVNDLSIPSDLGKDTKNNNPTADNVVVDLSPQRVPPRTGDTELNNRFPVHVTGAEVGNRMLVSVTAAEICHIMPVNVSAAEMGHIMPMNVVAAETGHIMPVNVVATELGNIALASATAMPPVEMLMVAHPDRKLPPIDSTKNACLPPPPDYEECMQSSKVVTTVLGNQVPVLDERNYNDFSGNYQGVIYNQSENYGQLNAVQGVKIEPELQSKQNDNFASTALKPKLRTRCYSFDADDDRLPGLSNDNVTKNGHRQRRKSSKRKKKKKLLNKVSRVGDTNTKKSDESSDDQQSICVNVKTKVSTRLTRTKSRKDKNDNENLQKIEECSESVSSDTGGSRAHTKKELPLTSRNDETFHKEGNKHKKVTFTLVEHDGFNSNSALQRENRDRAEGVPSLAWTDTQNV